MSFNQVDNILVTINNTKQWYRYCPVLHTAQVSNVIVNSNNNRNNNNNNDFQATFGSVNTNTQSAEATQTGSTMTMITVSPVGVPAVVPLGRLVVVSQPT